MDRIKVKESEWPIELFYNKTVNTFKKKQQLIGGSEVDWTLHFFLINEFEKNDYKIDVEYTFIQKIFNDDLPISYKPVRREMCLKPAQTNWNFRLRAQLQYEKCTPGNGISIQEMANRDARLTHRYKS